MNARHASFVHEYLVDLCATRAYRRVYPRSSEATANRNGSKLLQDPAVAAAIAEAHAARSERTKVTSDRVLLELARVAFSDHRKLYHPDGRLKAPHELDEDTAAAVASSDVEETKAVGKVTIRTRKVRLWDKREALNLLGKHFGLFTDRVHVTGEVKTAPAASLDLGKLSDGQLLQFRALLEAAVPIPADGVPATTTEPRR